MSLWNRCQNVSLIMTFNIQCYNSILHNSNIKFDFELRCRHKVSQQIIFPLPRHTQIQPILSNLSLTISGEHTLTNLDDDDDDASDPLKQTTRVTASLLMPLLPILRLVTSRGDLDICDSEDEGRDLNGTGASDQTYDESAAKKAVKVGVEPESQ